MNYHQALVDVVRLLQGLALALCLLGHLTAGEVDEVDLPVPVQTIISSKKYCQQSEWCNNFSSWKTLFQTVSIRS